MMISLSHVGLVACCAVPLHPRSLSALRSTAPKQPPPLYGNSASNVIGCKASKRTICSSASSSAPGGAEGEGVEGGTAEGVGDGVEGGSAEDALQAAQSCIELFAANLKDEVMNFLPEAAIDSCLSRRGDATAEELSFDAMLAVATPEEFELDAYAHRALVLGQLRAMKALSTLRLSPTRCLQRYAVETSSGEEAVLTLQMVLQDSLEPRYRGMRLVKRWFLRGASGEPLSPELPTKPSPRHGPESVVLAQLEALRSQDARGVFEFASAANRRQFAGSLELFAQCLGSPSYRPLLGHRGAEILRSVQLEADRALVIVGVTSDPGDSPDGVPQRLVFAWALALQGRGAEEDPGCWMVDAVHPVTGGTMQVPPA